MELSDFTRLDWLFVTCAASVTSLRWLRVDYRAHPAVRLRFRVEACLTLLLIAASIGVLHDWNLTTEVAYEAGLYLAPVMVARGVTDSLLSWQRSTLGSRPSYTRRAAALLDRWLPDRLLFQYLPRVRSLVPASPIRSALTALLSAPASFGLLAPVYGAAIPLRTLHNPTLGNYLRSLAEVALCWSWLLCGSSEKFVPVVARTAWTGFLLNLAWSALLVPALILWQSAKRSLDALPVHSSPSRDPLFAWNADIRHLRIVRIAALLERWMPDRWIGLTPRAIPTFLLLVGLSSGSAILDTYVVTERLAGATAAGLSALPGWTQVRRFAELPRVFDVTPAEHTSYAVSRDHAYVLVSVSSGQSELRKLGSAAPALDLSACTPSLVFGEFAMSADHARAAWVDRDEVRLCDARSGQLISTVQFKGQPTVAGFRADGTLVAFAESELLVLDHAGSVQKSMSLSLDRSFVVQGARISSDGKRLIAWSHDGYFIMSLQGGSNPQPRVSALPAGAYGEPLMPSPDAERIAYCRQERLTIRDTRTNLNSFVATLPDHAPLCGALAWSPDGRFLASYSHSQWRGYEQHRLLLWQVDAHLPPIELALEYSVGSLAIPSGRSGVWARAEKGKIMQWTVFESDPQKGSGATW